MFLPPFLDLLTTDTVYWLPTTKYRDLYSHHIQCPFLFTSQLLHWVLKWHSSFKIIHANSYVLFLLYQVIFLPSYSTKRIHGHQFFFQLLSHLFHTPHTPPSPPAAGCSGRSSHSSTVPCFIGEQTGVHGGAKPHPMITSWGLSWADTRFAGVPHSHVQWLAAVARPAVKHALH